MIFSENRFPLFGIMLYKINRLRSAFLARSPMCFSTDAASTVTLSPERSGAVIEISLSAPGILG